MARYQIYFDTLEGEKRYNVDIDDTEILDTVLNDILAELRERGHTIVGISTGELKVIGNGRELDPSRTLAEQEIRPNDVLRVLVESYEGGGMSLRMDRIAQEWKLLQRLQALNPEFLTVFNRTSQPTEEIFYLRLLQSPGVEAILDKQPVVRNEHTLRLCFPRFYPDVPIECYVKEPLFHPNVRLETGFVCLWGRFGFSDTAIQAVCRAQAVAAYRMVNLRDDHVMNREAATWYLQEGRSRNSVPLGRNELRVFESERGYIRWLEPNRIMIKRPSRRLEAM